jgi:hypothetical protein
MLIPPEQLDQVARGQVTLCFRKWRRPTVREGERLHTAIGLVAIERMETVSEQTISPADVRRAGYRSREALLERLRDYPGGKIYRVEVRHVGPDPRAALRARSRAELSAEEVADIQAKLAELDNARRDGPWTHPLIGLIARNPRRPGGELAQEMGIDRDTFRSLVRKLGRIGLIESFHPGYRLSARGRAIYAMS